MTIHELIELLQKIPNQEQQIYLATFDISGELGLVTPHGTNTSGNGNVYIY